jgi:hypothetical protein
VDRQPDPPAGLEDTQRAGIFADNARRFYGLPPLIDLERETP